jgi:endonuclease/exonuclease/phosphatase family metal-dependent hydrolase
MLRRAITALALFAAACAGPTTVRVVCWNIHHGRGLDDRVDPERIAAELAALGADVACLQEVDVGVARSDRIDLPLELAQRLGFDAAFGKNLDYQGGDYGNAILSRWPIVEQHNLHFDMLRPNEQRGLLQARVNIAGRDLWILSTHLDYRGDDAERRQNVAQILGRAAELGPAVVLAGDFNDVPQSAVHDALTAMFVDAFAVAGGGAGDSYPATQPKKRIDWVLVKDRGALVPVAARTVPTAASDHRPVVIDLVLR